MSKLILNSELNLYERNGQAFCSSRQVAEEINRRHDHILRNIDDITAPTSGVSEEFTALNFQEVKYKDSTGKRNREYLMTRDGFAMVAMEIKGSKAREFKEAYIKRFNAMERFIESRYTARLESRDLTDAVQLLHNPPKGYHYSNEFDMINKIVLGMRAREFRLKHGIPKDGSIRDHLMLWEIEAIEKLQAFDSHLAKIMPDYRQRKVFLQEYYAKISGAQPCQLTGS